MMRSERPVPKHPYRDAAIFYGILAGLLVLITALTGGNMFPGDVENRFGILEAIGRLGAVPVAIGFFVVATGFSWWRWWKRLEGGGVNRRP